MPIDRDPHMPIGRDPEMPIGSSRQSRKSKGRDRDSEMLIDSSQQSRKGKGEDRDPEMPIDRDPEMRIGSSWSKKGSRQLRKRKGRDRDPEMPIDSSQDKGKDGDPEMPIDSSQGKGFDDGQHTKVEQVIDSSSEYSEKEYCDICGDDSHWPPLCNYLVYIPSDKQPINRRKYQLVCFCGCAVHENGEFTCGSCFLGAPKSVSLKEDVLPPREKFGPLSDFYPEELRRAVEYHNKFMADRCQEYGDKNYEYCDTDSDIELDEG